jgi:predicted MFS family arabinose efflux permease
VTEQVGCIAEGGTNIAEIPSRDDMGVQATSNWTAIFSLSLTVICLVTAELLPVSLLTPLASDLAVTEGLAGQAISATSLVAMFASLFIAAATRRYDRRHVMLGFTALFIVSNVVVGFASDFFTLLVGRVILGISIGGFWSMSAAISMRLVPEAAVPKALSIVFGGVSLAMLIAGPVGSFVGNLIGWRGVFLSTSSVGIAAFIWQSVVLPSMPPLGRSRMGALFGLLARARIPVGMIAMILVFGGHFAFFTYMRPFLESVTGLGVSGVSLVLLGFGASNIVGTFFSGPLIARSLPITLAVMPSAMAVIAGGLAIFGDVVWATAVLVATWGFAFGSVPVAWMTWTTRTVPDETESAGGLQVAAIQLAITAGAGAGGLLLETSGPTATILGAGVALGLAAFIVLVGLRIQTSTH